jgi:IS4 transposase
MKRKINTGIQGRERDREKAQQTNVPRSDEVRDNDEEADFSYEAADRTEKKATTTTVQLLRLFLCLFLFLRELVWFAAACSSADAEEKKGEREKTLERRQSGAKPRPRHQHR